MPVDKTPWTDETVMPWGTHQGKKLEDVPAGYLLWLYEQRWIRDWPGLHAYLQRNEELLLQEKAERDGEDTDHTPAKGFSTYEEYLRTYRNL